MTKIKDILESDKPLPRSWGLLALIAVSPVFFAINYFGYPDRAYLAVIFLIVLLGSVLVSFKAWKNSGFVVAVSGLFIFHSAIVVFFGIKFPEFGPSILIFLPISILDLYFDLYIIKIIGGLSFWRR
ncbi:hypothetical protein [Sphingomonas pruni]|uniref:hypothetical protein n=1 Tax=Sphingomonas pruni TaxID=40683 RepID=UPI0012EE9AC3|nr:hypothetical protein [Sphingomonas pruni]